jgi:hypothetical protein
LLLHKSEIRKLFELRFVKGNALVPLGFIESGRLKSPRRRQGQSVNDKRATEETESDRELKRATMHRFKGKKMPGDCLEWVLCAAVMVGVIVTVVGQASFVERSSHRPNHQQPPAPGQGPFSLDQFVELLPGDDQLVSRAQPPRPAWSNSKPRASTRS